MNRQAGYAIGTSNALIFIDRKKHRFAALIARRCRNSPHVAKEPAKEPFFDRTSRGRDGRQSQLMLSILPLFINPRSIQDRHKLASGIEDRSACATEIRVPRSKVLPAMHKHRPFFNNGSADPVRPFHIFRPDTPQPDTSMFELIGLRLVSAMVNGDSVAIAKQNDILFLADDRIKAVDFLPCVHNEVGDRFPGNTQLALRDDVGRGRALRVDVIVRDASPPGIEYFFGITSRICATDGRIDFVYVT
jgi:hypothetical protein